MSKKIKDVLFIFFICLTVLTCDHSSKLENNSSDNSDVSVDLGHTNNTNGGNVNDIEKKYVFIENLEAKDDDNELINIPDENLANFIRECHKLESSVSITKRHIRLFKEFSFAKCKTEDTEGAPKALIHDLTGMEYAENLEKIRVRNSHVKDLGPIQNLTKLKDVRFRGNDIVSTSLLQNLTQLEFLCLGGMSSLVDVSGLDKLVNLKTLNLDNTNIETIEFASKLTKLEKLTFDSSRVGDITPITNLATLKILRIEGKKISSGIGGTDHTRITSLEPLQNLTNLEELKFSRHNITDVKILSKLTQLKKLELSRNETLTDLSPLLDLEHIVNDDLKLYQESVGLNFNNSVECITKAKAFKTRWDTADDIAKETLKTEYTGLAKNIQIFLKGIVEE